VKKLVILGVLTAIGGSGGWWILRDNGSPAAEGGHAMVKRGDFRIAITEQGAFSAKESVEIKVEPEAFQNQLTITKITAAGAAVKKDEVLLEFDRNEITRLVSQAQMELQAGKNDLVQATEDLKIQKAQNRFDMERAIDDHERAVANLRKWNELEAPKALKEAEARVGDAQTTLDEAVTNHKALVKMREEDLVSESELKRAELAVRKAQTDLEFSQMSLKLLKEYDHPQNLKRLQNDVTIQKAWLDGKQSAIEAQLAQKESAALRAQNALQEKTDYLDKLKRDAELLTIKAPCDGIFLHGDPDGWRGQKEMKVGTKVQAHETLGSIPDLSAFKVKLGVSEADINKVKVALAATIKPEALPELSFKAAVSKVSTITGNNRWWAPDAANKFDVELELEGVDTRLKPGMKCKVDVGIDEVKGALHVPLDAVFEKDGKSICWVLGAVKVEERTVKVGRSSADFAEIVEGLKEGEKVALYDPMKK